MEELQKHNKLKEIVGSNFGKNLRKEDCYNQDHVRERRILTTHRNVRFQVFTAVTMKNDIFWDVKQRGSCKS
jgi:hypothetical protein